MGFSIFLMFRVSLRVSHEILGFLFTIDIILSSMDVLRKSESERKNVFKISRVID